jgi:hypothetical protein
MPSTAEDLQTAQATSTLLEFIKILVKEYPLVFKNGSGKLTITPSEQCPYEAHLEIRPKQE